MMEDDPQRIEHINIGKETDLFLVAPASANTIAKLAMGLADKYGHKHSSSLASKN